MKVIFINPILKKETQHPLLRSVVFSSPPLGVAYVAAYLRKEHPDVDLTIIDEVATLLSDDELIDEISETRDLVLIGVSTLTATYSRAIELAQKIKSARSDAVVIFGGVHPTALPEESLKTGFVDIVVRYEGEITMVEIYEAFLKGANFYEIKGISYIKEGKIYHNPQREYIDLNILPKFPYDLFEHNIKKYSDFGFMLSSRGCPFDCIFCSNRLITGRRYRTFNNDYVIEQMETLINKYDQKSIFFGDDTLVSDKKRFFNLVDTILERNLHKKAFFIAQLRGEDMTREILEYMKKANFRSLFCGIETSSERLMTFINKRETFNEVKEGVELAASKGFLTSATFIYGLPTETREDRKDSFRLARRLPLDSARFNIAIPYPGTKLFEIAKDEGRLHIAPRWTNFNVQYYLFGDDIPYVPVGTEKFTIIFETMWANIKFYLNPKVIITTIIKTDITGGIVISLQNRKNTLRLYINMLKIAALITRRLMYVSWKVFQKRFLKRKIDKLPYE